MAGIPVSDLRPLCFECAPYPDGPSLQPSCFPSLHCPPHSFRPTWPFRNPFLDFQEPQMVSVAQLVVVIGAESRLPVVSGLHSPPASRPPPPNPLSSTCSLWPLWMVLAVRDVKLMEEGPAGPKARSGQRVSPQEASVPLAHSPAARPQKLSHLCLSTTTYGLSEASLSCLCPALGIVHHCEDLETCLCWACVRPAPPDLCGPSRPAWFLQNEPNDHWTPPQCPVGEAVGRGCT